MIFSLFKRIRPLNLFIIALTQVLLRYTLIIPFLKLSNLSSAVGDAWFSMLVISTVLLAAGGYLINDAHDFAVDSINLRNHADAFRQKDLSFYGNVFLLAGVMAGFCISFFGNMKTVWGIHLFTAIILYNYSSYLKKVPLLAAIAVSLLTSLTLIIIYTSDAAAQKSELVKNLILGYSLFAFLLSMARETIKDLQDIKGDLAEQRKTLPLVAGSFFSKIFSSFLLFVLTALIGYIQIKGQQWTNIFAFLYVILTIQLPMVFVAIKVFRDNSPSQYYVSSQICRFVMIAGVLTMPLFYFTF